MSDFRSKQRELDGRSMTRIISYASTAAFLSLISAVVWTFQWRSSAEFHTVLESVTTFIALVTGGLALVRYYSQKQNVFLLIGTALVGTGLLDGYHALVTSPFLENSLPSDLKTLIPWSWLASRLFLSGILFVGFLAFKVDQDSNGLARRDEGIIYSATAGLTAASIFFFALIPLPDAYRASALIHRPAELIPAFLFAAVVWLQIKRGKWATDAFEHWFTLALIANVVVQALLMAVSGDLFDPAFDIAHGLKIVSYLMLLIGLSINTFHMFRELGVQKELQKGVEEQLRETQERLQYALDASSDGIWDWNINTGEVFFSRRWVESLGYTPEEIEPNFDAWNYLIHPDDMAHTLAAVEAYFKGETEVYENENRLLLKSGEYRHNLDRGRVVEWNPDGSPKRMVGTDTDVTARKRAEIALRTSELRHRAVVESMMDGLVIIDNQGIIESFNPAAERMFGYEPQEVIGRNVSVLMPEPFRNQNDAHLARYLETAEPHMVGSSREVVGVRSDGTEFPVDLRVTEMRVGNDVLFCAVARDISETKEAEEQLQRYIAEVEEARSQIEKQASELTRRAEELATARDRAEEATVAKSQFLASMSHEIRTPMNGVLGMTQLLLDTHLDPEQMEHVTTIRSSADSLLTIINDILDFSKIEAGKMEIEPIPFDLQMAVAEVAGLITGKAEEKGLELVIRYGPDQPRYFVGDPGRVRQILLNLVSNAVKFTKEGHVIIEVTTTDAADGATLIRIEVQDTGVGVSPEAQAKLFQPFSQADASTTRLFGGTGLGLAICRRLVELMGGRIGLESNLGRGSTFWFETPMPTHDPPPEQPRIEVELNGIRTLVVDDVEVNRRVLVEYLENLGLLVDSVESGYAALEYLKTHARNGEPVELIVSDYLMPEMDGEELGRHIKADANLCKAKLILATSAPSKGDAKRFEDLGFSAYVPKPVSPETLRDIVEVVVAGHSDRFVTRHAVREMRASPVRQPQTQSIPSVMTDSVRVLLAEDNVVNQKVATRMLQKIGCRVDVAANGSEAVIMWRDLPYDIVFMDCQMPELDGFEATRKIRELEGHERRTPIVALTANAMQGDREICLEAGMDDYMSKPIEATKLADVVARWAGVGASVR